MERLAEWHDLNMMLGGAAAALLGLLCVAASPHLDVLASPRHVPLRALALHTLIGYLTLLLLAACLLIPDQSALRLGLKLALLGAAGLGWLPIFVSRVACGGGRDQARRGTSGSGRSSPGVPPSPGWWRSAWRSRRA